VHFSNLASGFFPEGRGHQQFLGSRLPLLRSGRVEKWPFRSREPKRFRPTTSKNAKCGLFRAPLEARPLRDSSLAPNSHTRRFRPSPERGREPRRPRREPLRDRLRNRFGDPDRLLAAEEGTRQQFQGSRSPLLRSGRLKRAFGGLGMEPSLGQSQS
jgi:hypothetical protein